MLMAEFIHNHILTLITFTPVLGSAVILLLPKGRHGAIKWGSLIITLVPLLLSLFLYMEFDRSIAGFSRSEGIQFIERYVWIKDFNINVFMGVDGLSMPMVLLCALICPIAVLASWGVSSGVKGYFFLFLLLETGMLGVF
ncbi:MAG TPA: oxidoreductase, partial [Nitrospiraceae bacterium]|nr:oxidoreductase [Nitrospiraceae bacterium]